MVMFVRTQRLTLRPAWPEDAPELTQAIAHEAVARNLARLPWPYTIDDALGFAATFTDPLEPKFLIFAHEGGACRLVGGMAIGPFGDDPHAIGYWITPDAWGRGYATEAGAAVLRAAQARGIRRIAGQHFLDNPASGRVLRKLGFRPTGRVVPLVSSARTASAPSAHFEIVLGEQGDSDLDPETRMAA
jgi:RimJ/RimL family protein N-acetyltransferase